MQGLTTLSCWRVVAPPRDETNAFARAYPMGRVSHGLSTATEVKRKGRPVNRLRLLALAAFPILTHACDRGPGPADPAVDAPLAATTEEVYTVGASVGEDWETFGSIGAVAFSAAGALSIFDSQGYRVVVVGADGAHLRTFGRQGEGPGEWRFPFAFTVLRDGRTVVFDMPRPGTFEIYDAEGAFETGVTIDNTRGVPGSLLLPLGDGRLVSTGGPIFYPVASDDESAAEEDHRRDIHIFSLAGDDTRVLYRAWDLPPTEIAETIENERGRTEMTISRMRAYEPGLHLAVHMDGRLAVADSTTYVVKLIDADGNVTGTVGRPIAPVAVTEEVREATKALRIDALVPADIMGRLSGAEAARMRETFMEQVETMIFADEIPVITGMAVDGEGRFWITRSPAEVGGDPLTDILTAEGDYLGTLPADGPAIPDAFGPGGLMAYIEADEMGVQRVRVTRLVALERREH